MLWKSLSTLKTGDMIVINLCCVQYVRRNSSASTSVINPIRSAENVFHPEIAWGFAFCFAVQPSFKDWRITGLLLYFSIRSPSAHSENSHFILALNANTF